MNPDNLMDRPKNYLFGEERIEEAKERAQTIQTKLESLLNDPGINLDIINITSNGTGINYAVALKGQKYPLMTVKLQPDFEQQAFKKQYTHRIIFENSSGKPIAKELDPSSNLDSIEYALKAAISYFAQIETAVAAAALDQTRPAEVLDEKQFMEETEKMFARLMENLKGYEKEKSAFKLMWQNLANPGGKGLRKPKDEIGHLTGLNPGDLARHAALSINPDNRWANKMKKARTVTELVSELFGTRARRYAELKKITAARPKKASP